MDTQNIAQTPQRGHFNQFTTHPEFVKSLISEAEAAGVFSRGIESDGRQRGSSINVDVYGWDEAKNLVVVQVRECVFHPRRYNRVRKDYYLLGHTETGAVFAHPVESPVRSRKIKAETAEATVARVEAAIWGCGVEDLVDIVRQGDVAFVPAYPPSSAQPVLDESGECVREITIRDTHVIRVGSHGQLVRSGDDYFVSREARAEHTKRQHLTVRIRRGWYKVVAGYRASVWGFTEPKGD